MIARVVLTQFRGGGKKAYFTDNPNIQKGDLVIIETNKGDLIVVTVIQDQGLDRRLKKTAQNWIVQKVDLTEYLKRQDEKPKI